MAEDPRPIVLVVDDDDAVRSLIAEGLALAGFAIEEAATGAEALRLVSRLPAAVVLDVKLPDMSGVDVCRWIRATALTSSLPVLMMSGFLMTDEHRTLGLSSGADLYITKPVSPRGLAVAIDTLLRLRRAADEAHLSLAHARLLVGQLSGALSLADVLARVGDVTHALIRADVVRVRLLDPATGHLIVAASKGTRFPEADPLGTGLSALVMAERRTVAVADVTSDPRILYKERLEREGVASLLGAPVMVGDESVGVLVCWSRTPRAWSAEDVMRVETIAAHAAGAIRNARLFEENAHRRRIAESLAEMSLLASSSMDPGEVSRRVVTSVQRLLLADDVGLYRLEPETGHLVLSTRSGAADWEPRLGPGEGLNGFALRARQPVTTADSLADPRIVLTAEHRARLETFGSRAVLSVPLLVRDRAIGTVCATAARNRAFGPDEISVAAAFASHAAIALENSRLFEDSELRRQEAESLAEVGRLMSQSLDVAEVGARILGSLHRLVKTDTAALYVREDDAGTLRLLYATPGPTWDPVMQPGHGVSGLAIREGRPVEIPDVLSDPRVRMPDGMRARLEKLRFRAALGVPLAVQGQVIGAITMLATTGRTFTVDDVQLATALASHAAVALHNSRLFAERLAIAKQLETRERQQAAIVRIGRRALGAVQIDALLDEAAAIVAETLGIERVATFELSQDGTVLTPRAGLRWTADLCEAEVVRNSPTSRLLALGMPVVFEDTAARVSLMPSDFLAQQGIASGVEVVVDGLIPPFGVLGAYSDRPRRFSDDDVTFLRTAASVVGMAIVGIRAESALRRHADRLRIMREIDQAILAARSSSETAAVALEHLVKLIPCWRASVLLFDHEEATVGVFAVTGAGEEEFPPGPRYAITEIGADDLVELRGGRVHLVPDVTAVDAGPLMRQFAARGLRSYFRTPLTVRGELIGALTLSFDRPHAFSGVDVELTRELAEPLAVAIDQARLHERVLSSRARLQLLSRRRLEIEETERARLARELHDEIGQLLTGLKLSLERIERGPDRAPGAAIAAARQQVTELMARVRELSIDLRPAGLEDLGLIAALGALVQRYAAQTQITVTLKERGVQGRRFPREVESAAYRIIQEALTNVARYAGVATVTVRLWADDGQLGVQVEDRGRGFGPALARGTGLAGMRERAALLGGRLDVHSAADEGTCITAEFPLEAS